ncbi:MAG: TIGR02449 family protein [Pseudomonadota bacterium]
MWDTELKKLEYLVDDLLKACESLKRENAALRESQQALIAERAQLIEKHELARTKVEAMIQRMKAGGQQT